MYILQYNVMRSLIEKIYKFPHQGIQPSTFSFEEHLAAVCGLELRVVWVKSCAAANRIVHLPSGKSITTDSHSPLNNSPFLLHVMSGGGFPPTEHLM